MLKNLKNIDNPDYWAFRGNSKRQHCHSFIQYPAMMVPQMQGELIDTALLSNPEISSVFDPFVGSGTTLGETIFRGLDFAGVDINPLAILACTVKAKSGSIEILEKKSKQLIRYIKSDSCEIINVEFTSIDKWFLPKIQVELSKIRKAIENESSLWVRRFYWLVLAETVRLTSNSRLSTYKLHIMKLEDIAKIPSAIQVFTEILSKNIKEYKKQIFSLQEKGLLEKYKYSRNVELVLGDILETPSKLQKKYDLMITSPPYGDNTTTVPYGQFSFLPLQWINLNDIAKGLDIKKYTESAYSIDRQSIGGSSANYFEKVLKLEAKSPAFLRTLVQLKLDGKKRLASFVFDMDKSVPKIMSKLNKNAPMVWTLGNRRINDVEIPFDTILGELLEHYGATFESKFQRNIPTKRMAVRNKTSATMNKETILVFKA
jgi:hypothetical protein